MGHDIEGVGRRVAGHDGLGGLAEASSEAALIDEGTDVASAEGARGEGLGHGLGNVGFAEMVDQSIELSDFAIEIDATPGDLVEVDAALG